MLHSNVLLHGMYTFICLCICSVEKSIIFCKAARALTRWDTGWLCDCFGELETEQMIQCSLLAFGHGSSHLLSGTHHLQLYSEVLHWQFETLTYWRGLTVVTWADLCCSCFWFLSLDSVLSLFQSYIVKSEVAS